MEDINLKRPKDIPQEERKVNKPGFWTMRLASVLIDLGLLIVLLFSMIALLEISPLGDIKNGYYDTVMNIQKDYGTKPLVDGSDETFFTIVYLNEDNKKDYKDNYVFKDEDGKKYVTVQNPNLKDDKTLYKDLEKAYRSSLNKDKKYSAAKFNYRFVDYGIQVIGISISQFILILVIPLLNKRRVTIGQFLGGLRCVNSGLPTTAKWYKIVWRYFYIIVIEMALPVLTFLKIYAVAVIPLITYLIACFNKDKREIHDYICKTRFIDNKSYDPYNSEE